MDTKAILDTLTSNSSWLFDGAGTLIVSSAIGGGWVWLKRRGIQKQKYNPDVIESAANPTLPIPDGANTAAIINCSGRWEGRLRIASLNLDARFSAVLNQSGAKISGTWDSKFPPRSLFTNNAGKLDGDIVGADVKLTLISIMPNSPYFRADGQIVGDKITGTFESITGTPHQEGTFEIQRQPVD